MSEIIWVMDSDLCEMCGELLDDWGICPACGYDGIEWEREEEDEDWWYPDDEEVYYVGEYDQELATVPKVGTLKYEDEEWVRGLPPMPAPPDLN